MPSLQRVSWTQKRVNAIVLLLSGRAIQASSKLKRLVRLLQAQHKPKVGSGSRLSLVVDGTRRIVVPREDIPQLVYRTFRSPMLGGGRGRDSLYDKLRTAYVGVSRRNIAAALRHLELKQTMQPRPGRVMRPLRPKKPMRHWEMDITSISIGQPGLNRGFRDVLVVVDVFSKYMWTFPLRTHADAELFPPQREIGDALLALFLREGPLCMDFLKSRGEKNHKKSLYLNRRSQRKSHFL